MTSGRLTGQSRDTRLSDPIKPTRGGTRPGAGRKSSVTGSDVRPVTLRMSAEDRDTLTRAGDGVLSLGVQLAAAALRRQS